MYKCALVTEVLELQLRIIFTIDSYFSLKAFLISYVCPKAKVIQFSKI